MSSEEPADREAHFKHVAEYPLDVERQRDCYADMIEEFRKREQSQDRIRQLLTAERDEARATIQRVKALHSPARDFVVNPPSNVCAYDAFAWPCPTIQTIEEQS